MSTETLSLDLYKANVELQLRITRLLQETGHQWLEAVQRASAENVAETTAEIESLLRTGSWQSLATLPAESFWRLFQQRTGDVQLVNQIALKNQAAFTSGLQQALESWQKSISSVVGTSSVAHPLQDIFKQWGATWAEAIQPKKGNSTKGA
ncbi:phasin family protein [Pseudomonas aeruginosa]|uniref:phasin family protein n=1 Tax=Pseudomonas aeruginosa TaxID=287 RepID=UPI00053E868E|nr:phasin family protein [Pseudomonas aeruginosa]